jgi:hypothetical protein
MIPKDQRLYDKVKREANKKFGSPTGVYRSSWIVREYKKRGGKYKGSRPKSSGLKRWYKEKWVDLKRPIKDRKSGKIRGYESCGRSSAKKGKYPLCRPTLRISSKTPKTYKELGKKAVSKAKRKKSSSKRIQFGGAQYYGKKSKVMIKVPENAKKTALYAFKLRDLGFKGGIETGWKRAKQLATKDTIPIEDVRYMHAWFSRHLYASYPSYKKWKSNGRPKDSTWHNKRGIVSWLIWGGDAAFRWVNSNGVLSKMEAYFGKEFKKLSLD